MNGSYLNIQFYYIGWVVDQFLVFNISVRSSTK